MRFSSLFLSLKHIIPSHYSPCAPLLDRAAAISRPMPLRERESFEFEFERWFERERERESRLVSKQQKKGNLSFIFLVLSFLSYYLVGPVTMQVSPSMGPPTSSMGGTVRRRRRWWWCCCSVCVEVRRRGRRRGRMAPLLRTSPLSLFSSLSLSALLSSLL